MNVDETGKYTAHLITALLMDNQPPKKPDEISFQDIFEFSKKHNVCIMSLSAIEKLEDKPDETLLQKWKQKRDAATAQYIIQQHEAEIIFGKLEEQAIDYIPLKGYLLRSMYPKPEYREMADLDILIHDKDRIRIHQIMDSLGYTQDLNNGKKDDSYSKKPYMHVEMHFQLFTDISIERLKIKDDLFENPFAHAVQKINKHRYDFSADDMYMHMIVHNAKHYFGSGAGIRQIFDYMVFRQKNVVNDSQLNQRLESMNLLDFKNDSETIMQCWIDNVKPPERLHNMESLLFVSGSYGNMEGRIRNNLQKSGSAYIRFRLFPPYETLEPSYPILKKMPAALPAIWLYRIATKGLPRIRVLVRELMIYHTIHSKNDQIN